MAHQSEEVTALEARRYNDLSEVDAAHSNLEFLFLPYFTHESEFETQDFFRCLNTFLAACNEESTIAVLTSPIAAASLCAQLTNDIHIKLWVATKLENETKFSEASALRQHHAALLVLTKHSGSLEHTKTRIAYTYCPTCNKTTKDYGGKKHLYHEYGTMISDVWRDITVNFETLPLAVINRIKDLFGLPAHQYINIYDLRTQLVKLPVAKQYPLANSTTNNFSDRGSSESALLNADCIEALREIPDNSIDFCFADPPYNINKKYEGWDDDIDIQNYFEWCDKWLFELARVLKPGRTLAVLNIPQWCVRHFKYLRTILEFQDWIVWEALSRPVRMIMPAHYSVLCFTKGQPRPLPGISRKQNSKLELSSMLALKEDYCIRGACINRRKKSHVNDSQLATNLWWDIHRLKHNSRRVDHPCQLPPNFMNRLISLFTNEGEVVLDPFNGAGTTTLTAANLRRKYVGIELSTNYHTIALNRHFELEKGLDPFRKSEIVPTSKNSYVPRVTQQKYVVPKKILQLEVKQIAQLLGRIPTPEDVQNHSKHPIEYFDNYFSSWAEVTAAAKTTGMSEDRPDEKNISQLSIWEESQADYGNKNSSKHRAI